jgi:hypothetical protein
MMLSGHSESPPFPREICGYQVERELTSGVTYLGVGSGNRKVVLKRLDEDCLLGKALHPSIAERLNRVRELAHVAVANLHGVVREGTDTFLVWEFVPGSTFDERLASPDRPVLELLVLAREIILHVESLHMQGIVHGSIAGGNVIVGADGSVRLTHISPLLYSEPVADFEAVVALLRSAADRCPDRHAPLRTLLVEAAETGMNLRTLGARIAVLLESGGKPPAIERAPERRLRARTLVEILVVAVLGLALGWGVWRAFDGGALRDPFHWIPDSSSAK